MNCLNAIPVWAQIFGPKDFKAAKSLPDDVLMKHMPESDLCRFIYWSEDPPSGLRDVKFNEFEQSIAAKAAASAPKCHFTIAALKPDSLLHRGMHLY